MSSLLLTANDVGILEPGSCGVFFSTKVGESLLYAPLMTKAISKTYGKKYLNILCKKY